MISKKPCVRCTGHFLMLLSLFWSNRSHCHFSKGAENTTEMTKNKRTFLPSWNMKTEEMSNWAFLVFPPRCGSFYRFRWEDASLPEQAEELRCQNEADSSQPVFHGDLCSFQESSPPGRHPPTHGLTSASHLHVIISCSERAKAITLEYLRSSREDTGRSSHSTRCSISRKKLLQPVLLNTNQDAETPTHAQKSHWSVSRQTIVPTS